ncbi:ABC transporter substrate-binding protein [Ramlibacter terrae]|uniref:ABC transporter substrate-binding protein n=1 Tax=Ramlibacter terrae TaxID=2732511 RepID=A0ABX6P2L8_9BURK|nr:ABC transporter substrate-binding protein [Ramlibacter terrae]
MIRRTALALLACVATMGVQAQTKVTVGHTGVADYLGAFVAQEEGFFRKHGLEVTFQQVAGGALVPGLQGGSLQMATLPPTNMLLANDGGRTSSPWPAPACWSSRTPTSACWSAATVASPPPRTSSARGSACPPSAASCT